MAEAAARRAVVTLERDPEPGCRGARVSAPRAGVSARVDLVEGDALETIPALEGQFDLLFVDAAKDEYARYIELAEEKLSSARCSWWTTCSCSARWRSRRIPDTFWRPAALASARALNAELLSSERWLGSLPCVGDGVGLAARTP